MLLFRGEHAVSDLSTSLRPWITFAGCVLVVAVLYWAQAVLVPLAIAALLTFLLAPRVTWMERFVRRPVAIGLVVILTFTVMGAASWAVARQLSLLADSLPSYRSNIRQKVIDLQNATRGGSVEKVQQTLEAIQRDIEASDPPTGARGEPVVVASEQVSRLWRFPAWVGPLVEPLSTASLVIIMVIFMLMERQELRDRLIGLVGAGHLASTTRAIDEAATRVGRYLIMQTLVNLTYGVAVAVGLFLIGVPYATLWGSLGAVLRFIPYVGPLIAAAAPILISLAALPGWERPLYVIGLFVGIELFTNMVLETLLYAGAAGISQVALLIAVAFWTWLWGPLGLLLATPLTVCLVVIGKHVPGFEFISTLMSDAPSLRADVRYYQRVLARDAAEAADILESHAAELGADTVFDGLMLPALTWAERDRIGARLSVEEERAVVEMTGELLEDAALLLRNSRPAPGDATDRHATAPVTVLAYPAGGEADLLALRMLAQLVSDLPITLDIRSPRMLASELVADVQASGVGIVCIADLPPSAPSKTRYLVRRLRHMIPQVKIVVGRWAPAELADDTTAPVVEAGADLVGVTLSETRDHLRSLVPQVAATTPAA
jgi:predicted PurR-regulated permease PerM